MGHGSFAPDQRKMQNVKKERKKKLGKEGKVEQKLSNPVKKNKLNPYWRIKEYSFNQYPVQYPVNN